MNWIVRQSKKNDMAITDNNVVGSLFWANMAAEQVYNAFEKRAKAVAELQGVIKWLFGLFTAGGLVLSFFAKSGEYHTNALVLFGLGFSVLVLAYYFTTQATFPVAMELRPNEPIEIAAAFSESIIINTRRFNQASVVTFVGFLFIAFGILAQFAGRGTSNAPVPAKPVELSVITGIQLIRDSVAIPVTSQFKKSVPVMVHVMACKKSLSEKDSTLYLKVFNPDTLGRMYASCLLVKSRRTCFRVSVTVAELAKDGSIKQTSLSKDLSLPKSSAN
jgi:hypothetical protein